MNGTAGRREGADGPTPPCADWWREYELCRNGIKDYDDFLFRVRTWSITVNALFLGAVLTLKPDETSPLKYGVAAMLIAGVALCFWIQDAANKSLQLVYIRSSRKLERAIDKGEADHLAMHPSISHRFIARNNNLNSRVLRRMWETSVLIYHVPIIILSYIVILFSSYASARENTQISVAVQTDHTAILLGLLPLILILLSLFIYLFLEECDEEEVFAELCNRSDDWTSSGTLLDEINDLRGRKQISGSSPVARFFAPRFQFSIKED